jgi:uncharacterized YccA/Bax inhibitor family protein
MQSNNPVFRRSEEFNRGGTTGYGSDPAQWGTGTPGLPAQAPVTTGPMTIDSVVQKTAITLGVVILAAAATWIMTPDIATATTAEDLAPLYLAVMIGSFGAFGLSLVNSFKRVISPPLVIAFAVLEGVALGALSKVFESAFPAAEGLVTQAVVGTFAAFGGTLAAYKFFNIQVGNKFRTFVVAAMFGMVALGLFEFVLGMFSSELGLFGFGGLGLLFSIAGLVLGIFMLILDFDFVEQGIANQIPERESWRAAFGMTVSLVWIYTNLLRILAIFSQE